MTAMLTLAASIDASAMVASERAGLNVYLLITKWAGPAGSAKSGGSVKDKAELGHWSAGGGSSTGTSVRHAQRRTVLA